MERSGDSGTQAAPAGSDNALLLAIGISRLRRTSEVANDSAGDIPRSKITLVALCAALLLAPVVLDHISYLWVLAFPLPLIVLWLMLKLRRADALRFRTVVEERGLAQKLFSEEFPAGPHRTRSFLFFWKTSNECGSDRRARALRETANALAGNSGNKRSDIMHSISHYIAPLAAISAWGIFNEFSDLLMEFLRTSLLPDRIVLFSMAGLLGAVILQDFSSRSSIAREQLALACEALLSTELQQQAALLEQQRLDSELFPDKVPDHEWRAQAMANGSRIVDADFSGDRPPPGQRLGRDLNFVDLMRRSDNKS